MKKKILSQLMILSFAFAGLFLVGNNVLGNGGQSDDLEPGQPTLYQSMSYCGGWTIKLSCTTTPRATRCTRYACIH